MVFDQTTAMPSQGKPAVRFSAADSGDDILGRAEELESLVQRLLVAEQSTFQGEVSRFSLTVPQYVTLAAIATFDGGKERMGLIAKMSRQCSATMTGIVDRLEAMGLVKRDNNPHDRRSVLVELTEAGWAKIEEVKGARRQRLAAVLASIEPEMRVRIYEVLLQYADALEARM